MTSSSDNINISLIRELSSEILEKKDEKKILDGEIQALEAEIRSLLVGFYTLGEAADRLQVSIRTVLRRVQNNRYIGVNHGGKWYVEQDQIQDESYQIQRLQRGI